MLTMVFWGSYSPPSLRIPRPGQRRAAVHHRSRTGPSEHGREHQFQSQVVEYLPAGRGFWNGDVPGVVAEAVLRSTLIRLSPFFLVAGTVLMVL